VHRRLELNPEVLNGFEGMQSISTDARGFRTSRPINYRSKPAKTLRILAVGASTTEDIWLDDSKTWTSLLAQKLSKSLAREVEVINSGVSGTRAEHHLLTLLASEPFAPDVAIFMMGITDWNRAIKDQARSPARKILDMLKPFWLSQSVVFQATVAARDRLIRPTPVGK
jgi:lysophospholipase L1-like esterase